MRDARYTPPNRFRCSRLASGEVRIDNIGDYSTRFKSMNAALLYWATVAPDRVWLAERSGIGWRTISFSEARERIDRLAGALSEMGIDRVSPLLILSANSIDNALISYALMRQGGIAAPVSPQYGLAGANPARLTSACAILRPNAVYVEDAALFAEGLALDCLAGLPVIASKNERAGDLPFQALYQSSVTAASERPDDIARYLLTSGSTGEPKAVICTHAMTALNAAQLTACFDDTDPPVWVNSAPWSHSMGAHAVLHQSLHRGGTLYIDRGLPTQARFGETLRNLSEISPTGHSMVPAAWMMLTNELARDRNLAKRFFARVRVVQNGGAALGQDVVDHFEATAVKTVGEQISFGSGYGATETGPSICNVHWPNTRMGMLGLPIPGTSVKLVPAAGKAELRVRGPQVMQGYLGLPALSAAAFDEEGYYGLGDAVRLSNPADLTSSLIYEGRLSENFKLASGTFVGVSELRLAILSAVGPAVSDAVVCGEGHAQIGVLFYPDLNWNRSEVRAAVAEGLHRLNAGAKGQGSRVGRAMVLSDAPDPRRGEITDKGYIAQAVARSVHALLIEQLFAARAGEDVVVLSSP
ncbi:feruloyl-CoA synthase [Sphingobium sp. SCG-1]|nr:feruloyl-CoA synthase [Sphingobium sp. SCG-1]